MAAAASWQTTTVAHSPPDYLFDVINEVRVVALAVNVGRFFRGLSCVLSAGLRRGIQWRREQVYVTPAHQLHAAICAELLTRLRPL